MKKYPIYHAYVDGGCFDNGLLTARAYGSYVVYGVGDDTIEPGDIENLPIVLEQRRFNLLRHGKLRAKARPTNNIAEALSMQMLITALWATKILQQPGVKIRIFSDSKLIINQLLGLYKINNKNLLEAHQGSYNIVKRFEDKYKKSIFDVLWIEHVSGDEMKEILGH